VRESILENKTGEFTIDETGAVQFYGRLCVPQKSQVKEDIFREAHRTFLGRHIVLCTPFILERQRYIRNLKRLIGGKE
jgi:hypothetical protein